MVEPNDVRNYALEASWDHRVGQYPIVLAIAHTHDLNTKCLVSLRDRPGEFHIVAVVPDSIHGETLRLEPGGDGFIIARKRGEQFIPFLLPQPLVVHGRRYVVKVFAHLFSFCLIADTEENPQMEHGTGRSRDDKTDGRFTLRYAAVQRNHGFAFRGEREW